MENEFVNKVLKGEVTPEDIAKVEASLSEAGKKALRETIAIKEQRKAEEERLNKAKKDADERVAQDQIAQAEKAEKERKANEDKETTRKQKVSDAKAKFFTEYTIPPEQQQQYNNFLDSGSDDPTVIIGDLKKTFAALNSDALIEAKRKQDEMERSAAATTAAGAGSFPSNPAGSTPPKYSETTQKIAKDSNISLEAAEKIEKEGTHRFIG